ncbi:MAG: tRNA (N6-isopentenyl adenosine(37)-C2)-methylthiotransferase MiaB [Bacteroidetes bacterium]|nr:tRNA (N6-isopentenyl adenosine(37)-C2)-methylthiotransferase MiaB [Bacteroidota bacterium]
MSQTTQKIFQPLEEALAHHKPLGEERQGEAYMAAGAADARKLAYIETYGCQMNFSDTEIIASMLTDKGFSFTPNETEADLVLINTCSIRENAEQRVWHRLDHLKHIKKKRPGMMVGVVGCMAERLKTKLLDEEKLVDMVIGPDAYRSLPALIDEVESGQRAVNVLLSREETYAEIAPVRLNTNGVSAFISIMRGCNNMCSFCVVPFTRGRERSRDPESIVHEARELVSNGYREVTLLGQNVDSYRVEGTGFARLLERVAQVHPDLRVRFSTSNPRDMTDEVIHIIAAYPNICNFIHLPVQSGNTEILHKMNRGHHREWYLERIARIREIVPDIGLSTDIITGFCGETEAQHQDTLSLMEAVRYDSAFMFYYSERPGTPAAKKLPDDVPLEVKKRRLQEIVDLQNRHSLESNLKDVGCTFRVLIEGNSKRSESDWCGRNDQNKMLVFPKGSRTDLQPGSYVHVRVTQVTGATLIGEIV